MSKYERKKSRKRESDKAEIQYAANVEAKISAVDVTPVCHLVDCFQVHSVMGMDNGISGCETKDHDSSSMAETLCWV